MNPPDNSDPLDALLRENHPYVEDKGFTARVIRRLPCRRRSRLRRLILLGATAIGYALAIRWLPWELLKAPTSLSLNSQALLTYAAFVAIVGSLLWGVIAALGSEE